MQEKKIFPCEKSPRQSFAVSGRRNKVPFSKFRGYYVSEFYLRSLQTREQSRAPAAAHQSDCGWERRTQSTAFTASMGISMPVHSRKDSAPWKSTIPSPFMVGQPASRASLRKAVSSGE